MLHTKRDSADKEENIRVTYFESSPRAQSVSHPVLMNYFYSLLSTYAFVDIFSLLSINFSLHYFWKLLVLNIICSTGTRSLPGAIYS